MFLHCVSLSFLSLSRSLSVSDLHYYPHTTYNIKIVYIKILQKQKVKKEKVGCIILDAL